MTRMSPRRRGALVPLLLTGCHLPLCPPPVSYPPPPPVACPEVKGGADKPGEAAPDGPLLIDLPTALRLADGQNPEIAVARERVREALAVQERLDVLWLPNLELGPTWVRHDGQIQRANGEVFNAPRSSLFVGASAALAVDVGDALFFPLAARQTTAARRAGAAAVANQRLLEVALAYTDLLQQYAELRINEETLANARHLVALTESFERSGKGAAADTARARTEAAARERERLEVTARLGVVSARLGELLNLRGEAPLRPAEPALVPVALVPEELPLHDLVTRGLSLRPELAENRAQQEAALERWRAARVSPFVPNLRLAYAAGGFGGGPRSFFGDFGGRSDFSANAYWELRNLGFGDAAAVKERYAQYAQVSLRQAAVEARVVAEVLAAFRVAFARRQELDAAQRAVAAARESYRLNEERIRRAPEQGRPIELLQAIQALARTRQDYLQTVADYNRAQFRLYHALGNPPACALERGDDLPTGEPTVPPESAPAK